MRLNLVVAVVAGSAASVMGQAVGDEARPAIRPAPHLAPQGEIVRYDGHRSVRVAVRTPRELMTVLALTDDVLTCEGAGIGTFDVRFSPEQYAAFLEADIAHQVLIEDMQAHIDAWRAANEALRQQDSAWYEVFRDLGEIEARIDALAAAHPALATVSTIGQSIEGRPIRMVRITGAGAAPPLEDRPAIVINGTQHSRESLSPMTTMWFMEQLLEGYATDPRIAALVDRIDFHIVPMVNPDGYSYVWTNDPLWRKNRRVNTGSSCLGIDLNRNWGYQWGNNNGSSGDPCNQTYRGTAAFSEPETQAISAVVDGLAGQGKLRAHLDVHSYGSLLLSPWGYTTQAPLHLPTMDYLGGIMRDEIAGLRGTVYRAGQGSILLYVVSGGSRDYTYGVHGAVGWTIELPGTSFHPPASQILPVAQETELGLLALAEFFLPPAQIFALSLPAVATVGEPAEVMVSIANEVAGSGRLHYRIGTSGAFTELALTEPTEPGSTYYIANLPALQPAQCGEVIQYYVSAAGAGGGGGMAYYPAEGVNAPLEVTAYEAGATLAEDFESSAPGWMVWNHSSLTSGVWERVIPVGSLQNGVAAAPFAAGGGDWAFVTENGPVGGGPGAADVDGGPTVLTSPAFDLEGAVHAELGFSLWHYSVGGALDVLEVEVSADDGVNWLPAATYAHASGWRQEAIDLLDFIPATSTVRVRFSAIDSPNNSVTESGLDDVVVRVWRCDAACYANCDSSTTQPVLNVDDFTCFINSFAGAQGLPHEQQVSHYANCDGSITAPVLNVDDFTCFINAFAAGCR